MRLVVTVVAGILASACLEPVEEAKLEAGAPLGRSFNDPHVPQGDGAWFEGWYTRITDADGRRSVAVIVGSHRPTGVEYEPGMGLPGYLAVFVSEGGDQPTRSFEVFPPAVRLLSGGEPVASDPDFFGPSDFEWIADGYGTVTEDTIDVAIPGTVEVHISLWNRLPWNRFFSESGPEGEFGALPVPLHWHVESLGSAALYEVDICGEDGEVVTTMDGEGFGHQEKNWGSAFPSAWLWGQAASTDNRSQLVFAGGAIRLGPLGVEPYLAGYRSPRLTWDFRPNQLAFVTEKIIDACAGTLRMVVRNPVHTLVIEASAPPSTFAPVSIATAQGWQADVGAESFSAKYEIKAYVHGPFTGLFSYGKLVETMTFENGALEFGAGYACETW